MRPTGPRGDPLLTAVLIPALNEAEALPEVMEPLARVRVEGAAIAHVVVVDNGSTDGTAEVGRRAGVEVVREPVAGYGRACMRGIEALAARRPAPEALVVIDADDPLAASQLGRLLAPIVRGEADLVSGARVPAPARGGGANGRGRGAAGVPPHAALGNRLVAAVLQGCWGVPMTDLGPSRAVRFGRLLDLELDEPAYGWNVQMHVRALRAGWRVWEVPLAFEGRRKGTSKISRSLPGSVRAARGMLRTLAAELARQPRAEERN